MDNLARILTTEELIENCWQVGILDYKLRNTQREVKKAWIGSKEKSRRFYIESTRRLGKSSALLIFFTEECLSQPNRKCGFFAPVKDGLLDYIEPLIQKTFDDCPDVLRPIFDRQRFILKFANGSSIIFRGANNQQHRVRRGQEFNLAGIDEARDVDNLTELVESVVFPSLFSVDGHMIISSTPADTRSHALYGYKQRAEIEGWLIQITIWDAQKLDPEVYTLDRINEWKEETLKAPDGQEIWEREYECKWVINKRKLAVPEWRQTLVVPYGRDPYYNFYHHYIGIDWGYKDFTAIIFATANFRKARLEVDGELTYQGKDVRSDLIAEAIRGQMKTLWGATPIMWRMVSDSADPILINELNKFDGMQFVPVEKAHTLRAMLNEFRVLVAGGKVVIRPECQMTIHNLENAVWDDNRKKLDQDIFAHHFDHLMALVYLTRIWDQSTNPIPADFMIDGVRVLDLNFDKVGAKAKTEGGKALQEAFGGSKRGRP
jgi:hypothetical protein